MPKTLIQPINQPKNRKPSTQHPVILLTKTTTAFAIILKRGQAMDMAEIMLTRMGTAFATTALMLVRSLEIIAETGKAINTDMVRVRVADAGTVADVNRFFVNAH